MSRGFSATDMAMDVVVVNWNDQRFLPECLRALSSSTASPRVVVVDNGSTDGSVETVSRFPNVELIELDDNCGYAAAANTGIHHGSAPYVMVMNPDVRLAPDHLARLAARMEEAPEIAIAQGRLLAIGAPEFEAGEAAAENVVDSAGHAIRRSRMVVDRGQQQPDGPEWHREASVFSACGAAMMLRREAAEDIAGAGSVFDPALFAYKEDIDLGWRARLRGWDVRYIPTAVAWHVRGMPGTGQPARKPPATARRHSWMNHWLIIVKNDRVRHVLRHLPWILAWEVGRLGHALLRDPQLLPAYVQVWRLLPGALRERRRARRRQKLPDRAILRWFGGDAVLVGEKR